MVEQTQFQSNKKRGHMFQADPSSTMLGQHSPNIVTMSSDDMVLTVNKLNNTMLDVRMAEADQRILYKCQNLNEFGK